MPPSCCAPREGLLGWLQLLSRVACSFWVPPSCSPPREHSCSARPVDGPAPRVWASVAWSAQLLCQPRLPSPLPCCIPLFPQGVRAVLRLRAEEPLPRDGPGKSWLPPHMPATDELGHLGGTPPARSVFERLGSAATAAPCPSSARRCAPCWGGCAASDCFGLVSWSGRRQAETPSSFNRAHDVKPHTL